MFYADRTVDEQAQRLPLELRRKYAETQLDRIEIDGVEIKGYFEYSFLEEKSYVEQPTRSDDGIIHDLDSYTTFLTPRLIIKYNMMAIEDYRKLMHLLKRKNAVQVTCYDIVEDRRVTHEMYFAPPAMPMIYQQYLMTLGIREYTIELIGTNNKSNDGGALITFDFNFPEGNTPSTYIPQYNFTQIIVDTTKQVTLPEPTFIDTNGVEHPVSDMFYMGDYGYNSFDLIGWVTASGISYKVGDKYYFSNDTRLFAVWEEYN